MAMTEKERAKIKHEIALELRRELGIPLEPEDTQYEDGAIIFFRKFFGSSNSEGYEYAAIRPKRSHRWYVTNRSMPMTWSELTDFIIFKETAPPHIFQAHEDGWTLL